jgi:hypothetical protein
MAKRPGSNLSLPLFSSSDRNPMSWGRFDETVSAQNLRINRNLVRSKFVIMTLVGFNHKKQDCCPKSSDKSINVVNVWKFVQNFMAKIHPKSYRRNWSFVKSVPCRCCRRCRRSRRWPSRHRSSRRRCGEGSADRFWNKPEKNAKKFFTLCSKFFNLPSFPHSCTGYSLNRGCQIFLVQNTKTGKIYQIITNYTKCP